MENGLKQIDLVLKHTSENSIAVVESAVLKSSDQGVSRVCHERMPDDLHLMQMVEASSYNNNNDNNNNNTQLVTRHMSMKTY